jgi:hypothetical protein
MHFNINYARPLVDWCYQSILGLLKPCLKRAAAGRLWAKEGQEEGEGVYFFFLLDKQSLLFFHPLEPIISKSKKLWNVQE